MLRNLLICTALLISGKISAQYPAGQTYIERYKIIAIRESQRTGIPASIKLGQAILESAAGTSKLAEKANNHFGVKCGSNWNGDSYGLKDDEKAFLFFKKKSCFRKYNNAEESYIDHSEFLRRPNGPYQSLFSLDPKDYKAWAYGLKKAGYATASDYPQKLIGVIERYQLYQFDGGTPVKQNPKDEVIVSNEPAKPKEPLFKKAEKPIRINMVKVYIVKDSERVSDIASKCDLPLSYILKYNDYISSGHQQLHQNDIVYLQKKKKAFWGKKKVHYVGEGESIFTISQQYGVLEDKLRERNMMNEVDEPLPGQQIYLRGKRPADERIKTSKPLPREESKPPVEQKVPYKEPAGRPAVKDTIQLKPQPVQKDKPSPSSDLLDFVVVPTEKAVDTIQKVTAEPVSYKPVISGAKIAENPAKTALPSEPASVTPTTTSAPAKDSVKPVKSRINHTVVKGDTLYNISKRYNTTVAKIKELNQLATDNISLGQSLIIENE